MAQEGMIQEKDAENEGTARVLALQGCWSKYVQEMEMNPGWHRLPNRVAVYSDPVATQLIDPSGSIEKDYKARLALVKGKEGLGTQLENEEDINQLGSKAFRKISQSSEPVRTLSSSPLRSSKATGNQVQKYQLLHTLKRNQHLVMWNGLRMIEKI